MLNPVADELVEVFNIRFGYSNTPQAMADELIRAQLRIFALERKLEKEERNASAGYLRRAPSHRASKNALSASYLVTPSYPPLYRSS